MRIPRGSATRLAVVGAMALLFCVALTTPARGAEEAAAEDVVARVGTRVIKQKEYEYALRAVAEERAKRASMMGQAAPGFMTEEERAQVLQGMIDARVLSVMAEEAKPEVPASLVSRQLELFKSKYGSEEEFLKSLAEQGGTEEELVESIRDRIRVREFVRGKTESITATEEEVAAEYERRKNQGLLDTVDVSHILIKVLSSDEEVWAEAKERIDAARARIVDGEDFAEVAKEVSEDPGSAKNGGFFPNTPRGRMPAAFDRVAFTIPFGELSGPIRTEYGWHILTTSARGKVPLQDAARQITRELTPLKRRNEVKRLVEEAKSEMTIEVSLPPSTSDAADSDIPLPDEAS